MGGDAPSTHRPWNLLRPAEMLDPEEITHAIMWLASDAAQFATGLSLLVDAGFTIKWRRAGRVVRRSRPYLPGLGL
jgi:NAD(P)-dependent dehydrogenase (short-subunit alcohol dehydrogenase family)